MTTNDVPSTGLRRSTICVLSVFAVNGFGFASWVSRIPDTADRLDLSAGQVGLMLLPLSIGALLGLSAASRVSQRLGLARAVLVGGLILICGLLIVAAQVSWSPNLAGVMAGLLLVGFGNGIWDVAQNVEGAALERAVGRQIMAWFHAGFSAGTVLGALVGALLTFLRVPVGLHLVAVGALVIATLLWATAGFLATTVGEADTDPETQQPERQQPETQQTETQARAASAWTEPRTLAIGLLVLTAAFTEGVANDWLALAFVRGHGVDASLGVLALAVFLTTMTLGRIAGPYLLDRFGRVTVLRGLFGLAVLGSVLVVFGTTQVAFVGAALWGFGASLGFPVGMSAAADDPSRAGARIAVVSTIGYGAFLAGPPFLGFLGEHVGILRSLIAVGAMGLTAIVLASAARPAGTEVTRRP